MTRTRDAAKVAEALRLYHDEGLTRDEIALRMRVRGSTVSRWLDGTARPRGPRPTTTPETDALIIELRSGAVPVPFPALAEEVGMSPTGVRNRYYALTGRPRADRRKTPQTGELQ
jgi:hypothetical protein